MRTIDKSKLVKTLQLFTPEEFKTIETWLKSPWCNTNKSVLRFFQKLKKYYPHFNSPNCTKEYLFAQLFPQKNYSAKVILTLMMELNKQAELLLTQLQLNKEPATRERLLRNSYLQRHQTERFEKMIYQRITLLEEKPVSTKDELLELALLYEDLYFQPNPTVRYQPQQQILRRTNYFLDRLYALSKHRILNELVERKKIVKDDIDVPIDMNLLEQLRSSLLDPTINLYFQKKELEDELNRAGYTDYKTAFLHSHEQLEPRDQKILYMSLLNTAVRLKVQGEDNMLEEIFNLYQLGLEKKWLIHEGSITERTFNNIVLAANALQNIDYSQQFVKDYVPLLKENLQEDAQNWARAHTHYHVGKLESVIELLIGNKFSSHLYNLQSRVLLMKAYFDINHLNSTYSEYLIHYCLAFEKFIRRDKIISDERKDSYLNFMRWCKKLANRKNIGKDNGDEIKKLVQELTTAKNIQSKSWLIQKALQLHEKN